MSVLMNGCENCKHYIPGKCLNILNIISTTESRTNLFPGEGIRRFYFIDHQNTLQMRECLNFEDNV